MRKEKRVALANKNVNLYPGIRSQVLDVNNGVVLIKNEDTKPLKLEQVRIVHDPTHVLASFSL